MRNIKYTESKSFKCLENLRKTSLDLYLVHAGIVLHPISALAPRTNILSTSYYPAPEPTRQKTAPGILPQERCS